MQTGELRIGTRGSPLALVQAHAVRDALAAAHDIDPEKLAIVPIRTSGERITDRPLAEAGGKGLFTKEIDEALRDGRIDIAVHSAKDIETIPPPGIAIAACLPREDARDAFLSPIAASLDDLPAGARVGTTSPRRQALVLHRRPDLTVVPMRGNVGPRLDKLAAGEADATLLALAGLKRLGLADKATAVIEIDDWPPAAGQGVIAVTVREDDDESRAALGAIDHGPTWTALHAERAFLAELDGSCRTPIGGHATIVDGVLRLRGIIVKPDGGEAHRVDRTGPVSEAVLIGREAGYDLAMRGGRDFFAVA